MRSKVSNIFWLFLIVGMTSCTKESTTVLDNNMPNPVISETPEITLESISSAQLVAYTDSLVFVVEYTDGNGDLGDTDPDIMSIKLTDTRDSDNLIFGYHLSPRAPVDSEIAITGTISIVLQNTILLDDDNNEETTTFKIKLKDRAGNWSNEVETEMITIIR